MLHTNARMARWVSAEHCGAAGCRGWPQACGGPAPASRLAGPLRRLAFALRAQTCTAVARGGGRANRLSGSAVAVSVTNCFRLGSEAHLDRSERLQDLPGLTTAAGEQAANRPQRLAPWRRRASTASCPCRKELPTPVASGQGLCGHQRGRAAIPARSACDAKHSQFAPLNGRSIGIDQQLLFPRQRPPNPRLCFTSKLGCGSPPFPPYVLLQFRIEPHKTVGRR